MKCTPDNTQCPLHKELVASDARYQARIKELEEALTRTYRTIDAGDWGETKLDMSKRWMSIPWMEADKAVSEAQEALSTTTPDTAYQKALLEARIVQTEYLKNTYPTDSNGSYIHSSCLVKELKELRAQLAALGE